jgi:hypothetical protein
MLQNATQISELNSREVPRAWNQILIFQSRRQFCLLKRERGEEVHLRVVLYENRECSFSENNIFLDIALSKSRHLAIVRKNDTIQIGTQKFYLLGLIKKERRYISSCGLKGEPACYRGSYYKKDLNKSCSADNEQFFCADNFSVYCKQGKFECL